MNIAPSILPEADTAGTPSVMADWLELVKARLTAFVLFSAFAGYVVASRGAALNWLHAVLTVTGIGLVAAAAAALNEWIERARDARMERTSDRPIPAGRIPPGTAVSAGTAIALLGIGLLWMVAGPLPAALAVATLAIYLAIYTPLKTVSVWCVPVGAISGALPPLIGAVSATGRIEWSGVFLFAILALWQFPHFFAIAWMYQDDYAGAGLRVLPAGPRSGRKIGLAALLSSLLLLALIVEVTYAGLMSPWFLAAAIAPGIVLLGMSLDFLADPSRISARRLFLASIAYLPLILTFAVLL